ncbi:MAG TPA: hypothetical protein P5235_07135 [Saprospiraceae bacterium]|nr:hypothetical protein [Lewinellaceae bacterium]HRX29144.1 hypothetical protein [Saprospiraceae bacterium]
MIVSFPTISNKTLIVLGNGPSLKDELNYFQKSIFLQDIICVNNFPNTELYTVLKPKYFCIVAPGFFTASEDYNTKLRDTIIQSYVNNTSWESYIFIPFQAKKQKHFIKNLASNSNISICFYNTTPIEGLDYISNILFSLKLGMPRPHNVLIPALMNGINLGYKKIYLIGADHSWLPEITVNANNEVLINQKHFYDENTSTPKQMHKNHGIKNRYLHEVLEKFYFSFRSYHDINGYARCKNCRIINLTKNSFIDAFQKQNLAELETFD